MLDVIVFGATGFTGRLVAEYLRDHAGDIRWGIAGRNQAKLDAVATELGLDVPCLVADSNDRASLDALAAQTRVIATTVGPYARFGSELVAAAVAAGTHTCDLTGEPQWVRRMIDAHHTAAGTSGARIVHACGFDSVPSDLGTLMLQEAAIERFGAPFERVEMVVLGASGGVSGGTVASMLQVMEEASSKAVRKVLGDPYSLAGGMRGPDGGEQRSARYSKAAKAWTAPFLMAGINERIVRRSQHLLERFGTFGYQESMRTGPGLAGRAKAVAIAGGAMAGMVALQAGHVRKLAARFLPDQGEGPTAAAREAGFFKIRLFGHRAGGVASQALSATVVGSMDPGYGATAAMLAESAMCLATTTGPGGVLTPAFALGQPLIERLNKSRVTFAID